MKHYLKLKDKDITIDVGCGILKPGNNNNCPTVSGECSKCCHCTVSMSFSDFDLLWEAAKPHGMIGA